MTVSTTMVAQVSPYTVGDSGSFTETDFTFYKTAAAAILTADGITTSTIDSNLYDYCHALLICHLFESSAGRLEFKSESIGKWSGTKDSGNTSFWVQYKQIAATIQESPGEDSEDDYDAVTRADAEMDDLDMDQNDVFEVELT